MAIAWRRYSERQLVDYQRLKTLPQPLQLGLGQAGPGSACIDELARWCVVAEQQRPDAMSAALGITPSDDDKFLPVEAFDLEPRAPVGLIPVGYFSVQSLPRRVRICALPETSRACIRYPSNLISCNQSGPSGAFSTSFASWGFTQIGGGTSSTLQRVGGGRAEFAIPIIYQNSAPLCRCARKAREPPAEFEREARTDICRYRRPAEGSGLFVG